MKYTILVYENGADFGARTDGKQKDAYRDRAQRGPRGAGVPREPVVMNESVPHEMEGRRKMEDVCGPRSRE